MTREELEAEVNKAASDKAWVVLECVDICDTCSVKCPSKLTQVYSAMSRGDAWSCWNATEWVTAHTSYIRVATPRDLLRLD